jgi:hypothetical protein
MPSTGWNLFGNNQEIGTSNHQYCMAVTRTMTDVHVESNSVFLHALFQKEIELVVIKINRVVCLRFVQKKPLVLA